MATHRLNLPFLWGSATSAHRVEGANADENYTGPGREPAEVQASGSQDFFRPSCSKTG